MAKKLKTLVGITIGVLLIISMSTAFAQEFRTNPQAEIPQSQLQTQQSDVAQESSSSDQKPSECKKKFWCELVDSIMKCEAYEQQPEIDQDGNYTCCKYEDGKPDCPDPQE